MQIIVQLIWSQRVQWLCSLFLFNLFDWYTSKDLSSSSNIVSSSWSSLLLRTLVVLSTWLTELFSSKSSVCSFWMLLSLCWIFHLYCHFLSSFNCFCVLSWISLSFLLIILLIFYHSVLVMLFSVGSVVESYCVPLEVSCYIFFPQISYDPMWIFACLVKHLSLLPL
jgi:hypothetical protein